MASISIPMEIYQEKVLGCWLGKAVGGTLGGPVEGKEGPLSLTYYDPVPDKMLPNDDLDLQVVWLEAIRRRGLPIERRLLADAWLEHVHFWPDEYGVASRNLAHGLYPPISGSFDNGFTAGMGAAIRTELWACLAPGDPELAAALAREDACVDHAEEGIYAAEFLAALESAAFIGRDKGALLDISASIIPGDSRVACAIADTRDWWEDTHDWIIVRERILTKHGRQNFTDVAQNLAFTVLGWLAGDDFGNAICTAVNCGKDTDCTGATLGALLGILDPDSIAEKWLEPIGRDMVLSPGIVGMHHAATLDEFTLQVSELSQQVLKYYNSKVRLSQDLPFGDNPGVMPSHRHPSPAYTMLKAKAEPAESLVITEPLVVYVTYPPEIALTPGQWSNMRVKIVNPTRDDLAIRLKFRVPDSWTITDSDFTQILEAGGSTSRAFSIAPPEDSVRVYHNPLDLNFEAKGCRWTNTLGLVTTIPWLCWQIDSIPETCPNAPDNAEILEVAGHFQKIPEHTCALVAEFKLPHHKTLRYVVQASRTVRVWLDGEEINHHDGSYRVPAIHRAGGTGKDVKLLSGWHKLSIAVESGEVDDLFVAIGDGETWDWLRDIEWRLPGIDESS